MAKRCSVCGAAWEEPRTPGRNEDCACGAAWRRCANCRFCDLTRQQDWCREVSAREERPLDRDRVNCCSWFVLGDNYTAAREAAERAARARAALEALSGGGKE